MKCIFACSLLLLCTNLLFAQREKSKINWINGTVLDKKGEPVKKAAIYLDSVKTRTKTNKKGEFKIGLKSDSSLVSVHSWKYGLQNWTYQGDAEPVIIFTESSGVTSESDLQELGFKTGKKKKKTKQPKDYSKYLNMYQMIAAEVPGAVVNGTIIRLRGNAVNSVNSGQEPLLMVDGTVVSSLEYIFPREVVSVEVIRDERASLYGARGANGIILIELRK